VIDDFCALEYDPMPNSVTPRMDGFRPRPESEWPRMSESRLRFTWLARARARLAKQKRGLAGLEAPSLSRILELALFLRVAAAFAVEWHVRRMGVSRVCMFPDADYYWILAGTIRQGLAYEVMEWGDIPHFALRTPGYPFFLAACHYVLGAHSLGVRVVQAGLGTLSVWLVYRLSRDVLGGKSQMEGLQTSPRATTVEGEPTRRAWSVPLLAAALVAAHPYIVLMSALILSEAVFVPLMLVSLCGLAMLWNGASAGPTAGPWRQRLLALGIGAASGAAVLVRPSWALFIPLVIVAAVWSWIWTQRQKPIPSLQLAAVILLGVVAVMCPWWVRNARVLGRFVPTAVWLGASLYDGLNPRATGASNMDGFLASPEFWPLDEVDQDQALLREALAFVREQPGRVLELAIIKLGRFWSPWPNAEGFRSLILALASAVVVVPLLVFLALGLWSRRSDARAWVLLAGPLLYFCVLHMFFASSMRYRIPGEVPAMGLTALGVLGTASRSIDQEGS
jgi:4-amino-4-deoxy-L-arabinose transferase-like glycosyltransferase